MKFEDFIYEQPKQLTPQFCKNLIEKYETNDQAIQARAQGHLGVGVWNIQTAKSFKQSEDVNISHLSEFIQEDKILNIALGKLTQNYLDHLSTFNYGFDPLLSIQYEDSGFQIQKTTPAGYYKWHHDQIKLRYYTYIFSASWQYVHQGIAPKDEIKYIATGWISEVYYEDPLDEPLELT